MSAETSDLAPQVSIIVPAYNAECYIAAAIGSMQAQSMPDWELIVVDDGSSDGTATIVRDASVADSRIRLFSQPNSGRPGVARNAGLAVATGRFIGFLDADDTFLPDRLQTCVRALHEHPACGFLFHDYATMDGQGNTLVQADLVNMGFLDDPRIKRTLSGNDLYQLDSSYLIGFMPTVYVACHTGAVLLRRDAFTPESLRFREDVAIGEDLDLWINLLQQTSALYINRPLSSYRQHATSLTTATMQFKHDTIRVLETHREWVDSRKDRGLSRRYRQRLRSLHAQLGYLSLLEGENGRARYWFGRGLGRYGGWKNALGMAKACVPWARLRNGLRSPRGD